MARPGEHISQNDESILSQGFVNGILMQAQNNLKRDGSLVPVLFFTFHEGDGGIMPLNLPDTHEERADYFTALGSTFVAAGKRIEEALFLSETWYVGAEANERLNLDVAPSQHPK